MVIKDKVIILIIFSTSVYFYAIRCINFIFIFPFYIGLMIYASVCGMASAGK